ncbi:MAG: hypothetical protein JW860_03525, partial [Sedimentisphaerales bacterium]|nr:hypothetical protein [Sedimentisphaerales bacterium]
MMIKKSVLFTVVLMLIGMFIGSGPSFSQTEENKVTPEAENNLNSLVEGNNIFALELYHKLIEEPDLKENDGNLFFSPYSISSALAMTWAGARGDTETQMAETLHFTLGQDKLHGTLGRLQKWLNAQGRDSGYQLSVANALWGQEGHSFLPEFLDLNNKYYGAGLNLVDFKNETAREQARQTINTWIE